MVGGKMSRAKTVALLCLMAHALFVCFTHFHETVRVRPPLSITSFTASSPTDSDQSPGSGGDSHCLSCRLQRNFISDTHTASIIDEAIKEPLSREIFLAILDSRGLRLSLSTRAPPLC
jgi:hypothetical protein